MRLFTKKVIHNFEGDPYLVRYTIVSTRWFRLFLHKILRSDDDRELHDHPWPFATLILRGKYTEELPAHDPPQFGPDGKMIVKSVVRSAGSFIRHKAEDAHRLELVRVWEPAGTTPPVPSWVPFRPVWTLFMAGPRKRDWGFHTASGWVQWEDYLKGRLPGDMEE